MSRKKLAIIGGCAGLVVVVVLVWIIGFGRDSDESTGDRSTRTTSVAPSPDEAAKKEAADAATKLVADITGGDLMRHNAAYSPNNASAMLPVGTKIQVEPDTALVFEAYGRVDATLDWPGKSVMQIIIVLEKTENGWLVHHMEKVA